MERFNKGVGKAPPPDPNQNMLVANHVPVSCFLALASWRPILEGDWKFTIRVISALFLVKTVTALMGTFSLEKDTLFITGVSGTVLLGDDVVAMIVSPPRVWDYSTREISNHRLVVMCGNWVFAWNDQCT